jgi:lipopolysaccharide heptosyltransferase II
VSACARIPKRSQYIREISATVHALTNDFPMASPRILVIRPDRIGDVVLSVPVLEALRHQWPDAYLAMMVRPYTRDILVGNPWIDEIVLDDPDHAHRGPTGFLKQLKTLRAGGFDTALMLLPTMRMAWLLFLSGIPRRIGVGHKVYQTMTFTRSVSRNRYVPLRHETDYCLDLAKAIGAQTETGQVAIFLSKEERSRAREVLNWSTEHPRIGLHPGHGQSAPNWTPERYGDLAHQLQVQYNAQIVVTGSGQETALVERMQARTSVPMVSLAGKLSLRQLIAVISELDVLISSSTGPMHLAGALAVPTVSIFCPLPARSPQRWHPLGGHSTILLPPDGECVTCDHGPLCDLSSISIDLVLKAVKNQLTN